jgi:hypothetical protein
VSDYEKYLQKKKSSNLPPSVHEPVGYFALAPGVSAASVSLDFPRLGKFVLIKLLKSMYPGITEVALSHVALTGRRIDPLDFPRLRNFKFPCSYQLASYSPETLLSPPLSKFWAKLDMACIRDSHTVPFKARLQLCNLATPAISSFLTIKFDSIESPLLMDRITLNVSGFSSTISCSESIRFLTLRQQLTSKLVIEAVLDLCASLNLQSRKSCMTLLNANLDAGGCDVISECITAERLTKILERNVISEADKLLRELTVRFATNLVELHPSKIPLLQTACLSLLSEMSDMAPISDSVIDFMSLVTFSTSGQSTLLGSALFTEILRLSEVIDMRRQVFYSILQVS